MKNIFSPYSYLTELTYTEIDFNDFIKSVKPYDLRGTSSSPPPIDKSKIVEKIAIKNGYVVIFKNGNKLVAYLTDKNLKPARSLGVFSSVESVKDYLPYMK